MSMKLDDTDDKPWTGMPENRRTPQTAPQTTPRLPGKPQTTTKHRRPAVQHIP